ncbi:hypothetical protein F5880DRAFT_916235 [Lentinula raphanica]|nr:hypothetical protein F5880DRAFT_916235 [Lentinula raphanica]
MDCRQDASKEFISASAAPSPQRVAGSPESLSRSSSSSLIRRQTGHLYRVMASNFFHFAKQLAFLREPSDAYKKTLIQYQFDTEKILQETYLGEKVRQLSGKDPNQYVMLYAKACIDTDCARYTWQKLQESVPGWVKELNSCGGGGGMEKFRSTAMAKKVEDLKLGSDQAKDEVNQLLESLVTKHAVRDGTASSYDKAADDILKDLLENAYVGMSQPASSHPQGASQLASSHPQGASQPAESSHPQGASQPAESSHSQGAAPPSASQ